jgi:hypothetical protein
MVVGFRAAAAAAARTTTAPSRGARSRHGGGEEEQIPQDCQEGDAAAAMEQSGFRWCGGCDGEGQTRRIGCRPEVGMEGGLEEGAEARRRATSSADGRRGEGSDGGQGRAGGGQRLKEVSLKTFTVDRGRERKR